MKPKTIKTLKVVGVFTSGLIVGAVIMNLLDMYLNPLYLEFTRVKLHVEQELRASRTSRQKDTIRSLVHRWNVVDLNLENEDNFKALTTNPQWDDSSFFLPVHALIYKITRGETSERGARFAAGIDRGKLAISLESLGYQEAADRQWEIAQKMTGKKSVEDIKKLTLRLQTIENSEIHLQNEEAWLGQ